MLIAVSTILSACGSDAPTSHDSIGGGTTTIDGGGVDTSSPATDPSATTGGAETSAPQAAALDTVSIRLQGDWPHLDPTGRTAGSALQTTLLTNMLYDSLVVVGPDAADPSKPALLPYLAESWESTPSKLQFKIKKNATCADGSPVTASLVKQNADIQLLTPTVAVRFGAGPFTTTADDATNTFTLDLGTPYYDALYGFVEMRIVCPQGLADDSKLVEGADGSGPYTLESAEHGNQVVLKRRDDWAWGPNGMTAKDIPATIIAKVVTNETTAANMLLTGDLDVSQVGGADVDRLVADDNLINSTTTSFYNNTLIFNLDPKSPTTDIDVRKALFSAIDLNSWNQAANAGHGVISPSVIQPNADCYEPKTADLATKDPSPDKARQILLDAGWVAGSDGKLEKDGVPLKITLVSTTITGLGNGGEFLADQWNKAGITVDAQIPADYNTYLQHGLKSEFDALTTNYPFNQPNPNRAVSTFTGPIEIKWNEGPTPEADAELALAESTTGAERCQHWSRLQMLALENYYILPLASPIVNWFSNGITIFPGASWSNPIFFRASS